MSMNSGSSLNNNLLDDIKAGFGGYGFLDYYIKKLQGHMANKLNVPSFQIVKRVQQFGEPIGEAQGQILKMDNNRGVFITYSKTGSPLLQRGVLAHELGHIALHYGLSSKNAQMPSEHEKEATAFAYLILTDRSAHYDSFSDGGDKNDIVCILKEICKDFEPSIKD